MTIRVAIVQGDERLRSKLALLLGAAPGFELIASFSDCESALAFLPKSQADVVLLDSELPRQTAIDCIKKLKKTSVHSRILMTSMVAETCTLKAIEAGVVGFLSKDLPVTEILRVITEAHKGPGRRSLKNKTAPR